jgi:hypothetical protein
MTKYANYFGCALAQILDSHETYKRSEDQIIRCQRVEMDKVLKSELIIRL